MKPILVILATAALAFAPDRAEACASKDNEIAIVLGMVEDEVVLVRISLQEGSTSDLESVWTGSAALEAGPRRAFVGEIDPEAKPSDEVDRLIRVARAKAGKVEGFTPARRSSFEDCTSKLALKCGDVAIEDDGATLRIESLRAPLSASPEGLDPEDLAVTGVVRYTAGTAEIAVVNVGSGDPRFATSVRACDTRPCRHITTLHHGKQLDVVVVTDAP